MKKLSRREFIRVCGLSAAGIGLAGMAGPTIGSAFAAVAKGKPGVIWLQGAACSGCTSTLLNSAQPDIRQILEDIINMRYHPSLGETGLGLGAGDLLRIGQEQEDNFILVLDGAIPSKDNGSFGVFGGLGEKAMSFEELVKSLGQRAKYVMSVGTCSAYGGIAAAQPNPSGCVGVNGLIAEKKVLNVPGCPPHPDWIVGSLVHLILYGMPKTDDYGRAEIFYGGVIHDNCPRRQYFDNSKFAKVFGEVGCLLELGCRGPMAFADCSNRQWNSGKNWCIRAGGPCMSCTHPNFPDGSSPLYERMPNVSVLGITSTADTIGKVAGAATAIGLGAHLAGNILSGRVGAGKKAKGGELND